MKNDLKSLKSFFCLFKTQWIPYAAATLAVASRNFIITYINAMISSRVIAIVSSKDSLAGPILTIAVLVVCFAAADTIGVYFQTTVIHKISVILREKMFSHALNISLSDIDRFGRREELVARMNFDIDNAIGLLSYGLLSPIMYCISGIGAAVIVFRADWGICAVIYVLGLAAFLAQLFFSKLIRKHMAGIQEEKSAILSVSMQTFLNSAGIKMAGMAGYAAGIHQERVKRYTKAFSRKGMVDGGYGVIQGALRLFCFFGVFCYGLFGAGMELEEVVFISQLTPLMAAMFLSLSDCMANVQRSMVGIDRILALFRLPEEEDAGEEFTVRQKEKGIETDGLVCRYYDSEVRISNIDGADTSAFAEDRNIIALEGPSGCGKTTLLRLLLKLYPYSEGSLRFFGQEIDRCSRGSVRKNIAYVPQENVIFPGTVRENILLGNPRDAVSDEEIADVLKQIGADQWVERIGLDSALKEDGLNLSGGQRQMIAIARAVLYRKPVLILDESLAAVDDAHIRRIMFLLSEMQQDIYVIIVTHDNRVVERCSAVVSVRTEA